MELTGKQKRFLRAQAVTLKPIVQIGKAGLTNEIKDSVRAALDARELIKVNLLQNTDSTSDEVAQAFEEMGFSIVQQIGRMVLVFKVSAKKENRKLSDRVREMKNRNKEG